MKKVFALFMLLFVSAILCAENGIKVVTPLFQATDIPADEVSTVTDYFISKCAFAMRGKAEVVDRNSFDLLVEEHDFQTKDWASAEGRSQLEMLNATHLVKGQLSKFRSKIVVTIWFIDVKTAVVYATYEDRIADVEELFDKMPEICKNLAVQIDGTEQKNTSVNKSSPKETESKELARIKAEKQAAERKAAAEKKAREEAERKLKFASRKIYSIGDTGPGGGIVFYVSEEGFNVDDGKGNVEKCHYLEFSKEELGCMTWCPCPYESKKWCNPLTGVKIGDGKSNTYKIVMSNHFGKKEETTKNCAALACYKYSTATTKNGEWFLPSLDELICLYNSGFYEKNPKKDHLYWSSSIYTMNRQYAWEVGVYEDQYKYPKNYIVTSYEIDSKRFVRAVHAF